MTALSRREYIEEMARYELSRRLYEEYLLMVHRGNYKHMAHTKYIADRLQKIADGEQHHIIVELPPRHSKLCADSTPVYTPKGWTTHGNLKVGDYVYHPTGKAIKVLNVKPKNKADWLVTFSNGESIRVNGEHEWTVYNRSKHKYETLETQKMKDDCYTKGRCKYQLPNINSLENQEQELPMDPYTLGLWLGDGTATKPCITYDKKDYAMIEKIVNNGYEISTTCWHKDTNVPTTYFSGTRHNPGRMTKELTTIGLMNNKHVPDIYLRSSIQQRLELLAGLVDSDGHVDNKGRIRYTTTNKKIRDGVYQLVLSLGFRPYIMDYPPQDDPKWNIYGTKDVYVIGFNPTVDIPTQLERRKTNRLIEQRRIGITNIEYKPNGEVGNCITVDSDDGLYLVGNKLIPTHNSMTITETFPSYFIGRNPNKRVIATAYSEGLARKFGRLNRNKLLEFGNQIFGVSTANDNSTATNWSIDNNVGGMVATGIGGSITGEGADLLIIDDPIKNNAEAQSQTIRDKIWDEWETTLSTRLHKGASVIVVMTRWHEDDIVGRLIEKSPYNWERIRMPVIADSEDDLLRREVGEPLAKELGFDERWAELKKQEVGSKTWNALYQQRPSASEGNIFKREWWQYYEHVPRKFDKMIISWDLTFKGNDSNDYVVGQVWIKKGADKYLVDQVRGQMDFPATLQAVKSLARKYPQAREILIEDKANGPAVISSIQREVSGVIPITPKESKIARAQAITPQIESGNVFLPKYAAFVDDLIEECASFPNGSHDDCVDCMSQALNRLVEMRSAVASNINLW